MGGRKECSVKMSDLEKEIKLSWQQIVWGISVITLIVYTYADIRNKVMILSDSVSNIYTKQEEDKLVFKLEQNDLTMRSQIKVIEKKLNIDTGE